MGRSRNRDEPVRQLPGRNHRHSLDHHDRRGCPLRRCLLLLHLDHLIRTGAMLTAAGSPLVAGSAPANNVATVKVKVTKGFYIAGKLQEVGSEVELPDVMAADLIGRQKATKDLSWKPEK